MPKIIIEINATISMVGPARCIEGMEEVWWKKFSSAVAGIDSLNLMFFNKLKMAYNPPMDGAYVEFSIIDNLEDVETLPVNQYSQLSGAITSSIDGVARSASVTVNGRFAYWLGDSEGNDENLCRIKCNNDEVEALNALKNGKFLFASICQPIDKKGKIVKTNATWFSPEMWLLLAPSLKRAVAVPYSVIVE